MKKYILLLSLFLGTTLAYSQDFKQWAFDVEGGIHSVNDESAVDADQTYYLGAGFRYNFNPTFGLGARVGWNDLDLLSIEGVPANTRITRLNTDATINLFRILDLYSPWFTMLAHGGPGVAFIDRDNYNETVLNNQLGLTSLFKLHRSIALKLDYTVAANISQQRTLDGFYASNNYGVTSTVHSASAGLVFYLGKDKKEHADWYAYPDAPIMENVTNVFNSPVHETIIREEAQCDCDTEPQSEYVFFDHDKYDIKSTELNAIYKVYAQMEAHPNYQLFIKGFASATNSSTYYNQKLSEKRSAAIADKLVELGIDAGRIEIGSYGKDLPRSNESVHDAARRVELLIIKH